MKNQQLAITISASLAITMMAAAGCANKKNELEPRTDVRPMVNTIHQAEQDWLWIAAKKWHLILIESHAPIAGTTLNLSFKEHTWLTGNAGCNHFTANYTRKAEAGLQLSEVLSTRKYCASPTGVMQQESRFLHLLKQVDAYQAEPDRLHLYIDDTLALAFMILEEEPFPKTPLQSP